MPVYQRISAVDRPDWCRITSAGTFRIPREGGTCDNHYHDYDEYWLICKGRARVRSEGIDHLVGPGDIVCTQAGAEHDVLVVFEDLEAFWFEDATPPGGRVGHLHRTTEDAAGHPVARG